MTAQRLSDLPGVSPRMKMPQQIDGLKDRDVTLQKRIMELSRRLDAMEVFKEQTTDMLAEGKNNLYHTPLRVREAIKTPPLSPLVLRKSDGVLDIDRQWDDLRTPVDAIRLRGVPADPSPGAFPVGTNPQALYFSPTALNEVFITVQMPHTWWEGTAIYPHVHWGPIDSIAGNVEWEMEYSWANIGAVFGATATITVVDPIAAQNTHQIASFSAIDGTGMTISSILQIRLYRDGTAGNVHDTYGNSAALLEFDIHYQKNTFGSVTEFGKY